MNCLALMIGEASLIAVLINSTFQLGAGWWNSTSAKINLWWLPSWMSLTWRTNRAWFNWSSNSRGRTCKSYSAANCASCQCRVQFVYGAAERWGHEAGLCLVVELQSTTWFLANLEYLSTFTVEQIYHTWSIWDMLALKLSSQPRGFVSQLFFIVHLCLIPKFLSINIALVPKCRSMYLVLPNLCPHNWELGLISPSDFESNIGKHIELSLMDSSRLCLSPRAWDAQLISREEWGLTGYFVFNWEKYGNMKNEDFSDAPKGFHPGIVGISLWTYVKMGG